MGKALKVNKALIWDYDFKGKYETEEFKRWYLSRVLSRGSASDIGEIGFKTIRDYLPVLNLPERIRKFWEWYFSL